MRKTTIDLVPRLPSWGSGVPVLETREARIIDLIPRLARKNAKALALRKEDAIIDLCAAAYEWALKESRKYKIVALTISIENELPDLDCVDALFVGPNGEALLRQFWRSDNMIAYIWVCNYGSLERDHRLCVERMRRNAIDVYSEAVLAA